MDMYEAYSKRITKGACIISSHESRELRGLSSHTSKEFACRRARDLTCDSECDTMHKYSNVSFNKTHKNYSTICAVNAIIIFLQLQRKVAHPNEHFSFNLLSGQARALGSGSQPNETDLFTGWFADRLKNLGNTAHQGVSGPLDLNMFIGQGLRHPPNQEASLQ
ncbi:hypothetical protein PVK06_024065 [Gossypium arboreum]|uniref:Uncharacterized protein n=1 Tax=Gossypium arboreum TaxID=29729 RepID=A0ABR0PD02_GOSAR|nr:hypothetical protein PVK06_024065 [Gossypium arboreum]